MRLVRRAAAVARLLVGGVLVVAAACNRSLPEAACDLLVVNDIACTIVVFVDGRRAFAVAPRSERTLEDVGTGRHVLEATNSRGDLIERRPIELALGEDFVWTITRCA
jgi:hypothetical protein